MINNIINFSDYVSDTNLNELIDISYKELMSSNKGINLLDSMSTIINDKIIKEFDKYDDVSAFIIKYNGNDRVVLRHINNEYNNVFLEVLRKIGDSYYDKDNNEKSIRIYSNILQGICEPDPEIYYRLGVLYFKNNTRAGLDFLKIAVGVSDGETKEKYLDTLNRYINIIKEKNGNLYINNLDEILEYIINSGVDVESACQSLNFEREKIDIIKLRMAEFYFINKDVNKGMEFIKSVQFSKEKSYSTKLLLNSVIKNINFYPNRKSNNTRILSLKLKPGKPINNN